MKKTVVLGGALVATTSAYASITMPALDTSDAELAAAVVIGGLAIIMVTKWLINFFRG